MFLSKHLIITDHRYGTYNSRFQGKHESKSRLNKIQLSTRKSKRYYKPLYAARRRIQVHLSCLCGSHNIMYRKLMTSHNATHWWAIDVYHIKYLKGVYRKREKSALNNSADFQLKNGQFIRRKIVFIINDSYNTRTSV